MPFSMYFFSVIELKAHSYVNPCKLKLHSLEDLVLKRECSNKYVIILSPNKGNETVILNLEIN